MRKIGSGAGGGSFRWGGRCWPLGMADLGRDVKERRKSATDL